MNRNQKLWLYHEGKEKKEIWVYMKNKTLEQVQKIKYLGIIIDNKLNFRDQIIHI